MAREKEIYLGFSERWRNMPKPTIAAVQGKAISGGLMLIWPCDIIVASDDAEFIDNTVAMGVCGAEFFHHPWELGVRKAKEMLFTSDSVSALDAHRLGMVNHVVPRDELHDVHARAGRAHRDEAAVRAQAHQGSGERGARRAGPDRQPSQTSFASHQLCHSHNQLVHGRLIDPAFFERSWGARRG